MPEENTPRKSTGSDIVITLATITTIGLAALSCRIITGCKDRDLARTNNVETNKIIDYHRTYSSRTNNYSER